MFENIISGYGLPHPLFSHGDTKKVKVINRFFKIDLFSEYKQLASKQLLSKT